MYYEGAKPQQLMDLSLALPVSDIGSASTDSSSQSLSFYVDQTNDYHQLMDDLSIIDDIYNSYDHEQLNLAIDNQVAYSTKNGALKQQMVQHLIQTESQFLEDLYAFQLQFATTMPHYQFQKNKLAFRSTECDILFNPILSLITSHQTFLNELRQRLSIYGPTQITSDIFHRFFDHMDPFYSIYLNSFSTILMTFDRLHKTNAFVKFLESRQQQPDQPLQDFGYYIRLPLTRISIYTQAVNQCSQLTEPSHPDYNALLHISQRYKTRQQHWQSLIDDCLSHYRVYECFRLVQNSPAIVTPTRRLLLHSELIHVDPNSPTDTADRRFYILYNDLLIYCKRQKDGKLVYKGTVILDKATLKPMDSKVANKIYEKHQKSIQQQGNGGRKLSLFGMKKQQQQNSSNNDTVSAAGSPHRRTSTRTSTTSSSASSTASSNTTEEFAVYGLELYFQFVLDSNVMAYSNQLNGYGGAAINSTSASDSIRRHILRMKSLEEQNLWSEHLQHTIKALTSNR
ncbi:unnamed protein product [Absidia cylindrospora]